MHTITQLIRPRRPDPSYMGFYARYTDGQYIIGRGLGTDPISAYHAAILNALQNLNKLQNALRNAIE